MREILFRGFSVAEDGEGRVSINGKDYIGEWVEGGYYQIPMPPQCIAVAEDKTEHYIIFTRKDYLPDWNMPYQIAQADVIPETVGQFTGRYDKNGKRIFEGDRVFGTFYGFPWATRSESYISWNSEVCGLQMNYFDDEDIEVIGTVFDADESRIS